MIRVASEGHGRDQGGSWVLQGRQDLQGGLRGSVRLVVSVGGSGISGGR